MRTRTYGFMFYLPKLYMNIKWQLQVFIHHSASNLDFVESEGSLLSYLMGCYILYLPKAVVSGQTVPVIQHNILE